MSAADAPPDEILPKVALAFTRNLASLSAQSVLYGMYVITFSIAFISLVRRRGELPCLLLTIATVIMFGLSTFFWASSVSVFVDEMQLILGATYGDLSTRILDSNARTLKVRYSGDILFAFSYIIGDAVMAWRILVISRWRLFPSVALIGLWLGTTAMGLGLFGCVIHANWPPDADLPGLCTQMGNVAWVLSLAFNGLATTLLARIAWSHRKSATLISSSRRTTKVMRVLEILVVSGVIYFLLGVPRLTDFAKLTLSPFTTRLTMATQVIEDMLGQLVVRQSNRAPPVYRSDASETKGLYPTAVTTFLFYESQVFGGNTTFGSSNTRPTVQFVRGPIGRKATNDGDSPGTTMVTLSKRQQLSSEDMSVDQI
ncbi:hypothetical protein EXIGLDRAFT_775790 [Exidia glandulosa HHB12029]|uniref:Family A G protein-coupled receptor-like protein n=1 Tax=Exidia glandulosa HHB12029 TaxID=1314781 RepID=A0A165DRP5_EXIGL|nr:hypothetical protein EXIGLDRAFT_775790 [Exidia glandulosa HHB12029]